MNTQSSTKQLETYRIVLFTPTSSIYYDGCTTYEVSEFGAYAKISFKCGSDDWIDFYNAPFLIEKE